MAASEIHKAGQRGAEAARYLFWNIGFGALVQILGEMQLYAADKSFFVRIGRARQELRAVGRSAARTSATPAAISTFDAPTVSPAYMGVGYVIGPELWRRCNFSGGVLAWGVLVPLLMYFLGPQLQQFLPPGAGDGRMGRQRRGGVALHRPADRGGRHDGGRGLHVVPHAQESDVEPGTRAWRKCVTARRRSNPWPHRALHGFEDRRLA